MTEAESVKKDSQIVFDLNEMEKRGTQSVDADETRGSAARRGSVIEPGAEGILIQETTVINLSDRDEVQKNYSVRKD